MKANERPRAAGQAAGTGAATGMPLTGRQRRLLDAALILGVTALAFVVVADLWNAFIGWGDLILTFFLAWLVAFVLNPFVARIATVLPGHNRGAAVGLAYLVILLAAGLAGAALAAALAGSIDDLIAQLPTIQSRLPEIVAPIQAQLTGLGLRIDLGQEAGKLLENLGASAGELVGPLQSIAAASLGVLGTTLMVVILSVYIALDGGAIRAFAYRLVPERHHAEWRLLEKSVADAFGGFLRGQVGLGVVYGAVALLTSVALGLEFVPVTTASAAILQAIPFFGPFLSWAPPVLVAIFTKPDAIVPALAAMGVGWFVVMNILQPRLMKQAIGLHPIVVLGSVLVGSKVAGVAGAIFGIPIAAVASAMFVYYARIFGEGEPS